MTTAVLGLVASMASTIVSSKGSRETRIATQALRREVEDMRAVDFATLLARYRGHTFEVPGLRKRAAGGPHGSVAFLSEAEARAHFAGAAGAPLVDLDGDGALDESQAPAEGWKAYAVRLTVAWGDRTRDEDRTLELVTVIFDPGS